MEVIWKDVKGYEGIYKVLNFGVIKSLDHNVFHSNGRHRIQKGRILKTHISKKGYVMVCLSKKGKRLHTGVHRVVATAFVPNKNLKPQVNHIDGNKKNNNYKNLEWCTNSENQIHAVKNNLIKHNLGENHHMAKLSNNEVLKVRTLNKIGFSCKELAKDYSVSETAMSNILRKITYKNVK